MSVAEAEVPKSRRGLSSTNERKIDTRVGFTSSVHNALEARARRHGISMGDEVRRIVDWFLDDQEQKRSERVVVLDREKQMIRSTR